MFEQFNFTARARTIIGGIMVFGLLLIIIGAIVNGFSGGEGVRFWANFLLCNFYFTMISVTAIGWMSIQYLAKAGWSVSIKRIVEAISGYVYVGAAGMILLLLIGLFTEHSGAKAVFEWMHLDAHGDLKLPNGEIEHDEVLLGKRGYLNMTFFAIRMVIYFALWIFFARRYRALSLREDEIGGIEIYNTQVKTSAFFLPIYALSFCFASYDWMMSLEPHWYSTIYAVNIFAGALVSMLTIVALTGRTLKNNGYMKYLNSNHFHDVGKFMFGFSIFWCYTWISQFLLIWYANLPEETVYFYFRMHGGWWYLFFANFAINFLVPFLFLMMRDSKRNYKYLSGLGVVLLIGRYIDWYLLSMPGTAGRESYHTAGFGFYEIGFFLFFGGIFGYIVATRLSKASLIPQKHPFVEEALHHHI